MKTRPSIIERFRGRPGVAALVGITTLLMVLALTGSATASEESGGSGGLGFDPSIPQVTQLADGVYQYFHQMYNSLIIVTGDQVIVTDPAGAARATRLREAVRGITDRPVTTVIYSHDHYDHTRGGQIFKDEGANFIAHEKAVELLARDPYGEVVLPDTTYRDRMTLHLDGDATLDLIYYGPNDGDAMSILHFPQQKILFAVDFHLPRYVNEGFRLVAHNYGGIYETMKRIRDELDFEIVVSGHTPSSSPELFEEDFRFVEALYEAVLDGLREGKTPDQLAEEIRLPEFSHWQGYESNLPAHVQRMAYTIWHGN